MAGVSAKSDTLLLAGERGWIPMSINIIPPRVLHSHWEAVEEGASKSGKTPSRDNWRIAREIYVADTTEEARRGALEGTLTRDFHGYWEQLLPKAKMMDLLKVDPEMADSDVTPEYCMDNIWVVGSPDDVVEKLQKLYDDVGGFGVILAMGHEWQPDDGWRRSMTLLAEEVLPRLGGKN